MKYITLLLLLVINIVFVHSSSSSSSSVSSQSSVSIPDQKEGSAIVIPNLKYEELNKTFTLWGDNIGIEDFNSTNPFLIWIYNKGKNEFNSHWKYSNNSIFKNIPPPNIIIIEIGEKDYFLPLNAKEHKPEIKNLNKINKKLLITGLFFTYNVSEISITSDSEQCIVLNSSFGSIECTMENPTAFQLNSVALLVIGGDRGVSFKVDKINGSNYNNNNNGNGNNGNGNNTTGNNKNNSSKLIIGYTCILILSVIIQFLI